MKFDSKAGSVYAAFGLAAEAFGMRPFLRAPAGSIRDEAAASIDWTYLEAATEAARLQSLYAAHGLRSGARVALAFDSCLDVYLHLVALNGLGISVVPLNMGGSDREVAWVVGHSDSVLAVSADEYADRLSEIARSTACGSVPLAELNAGTSANATIVPGDTGREAALLYTSGTTGHPKGCILSNEYFLTMGRWYNGLGGLCALDCNDRLLTPLPPHHMNALCVSFMAMLLSGGCVMQLDRFHPSSWWQSVRDERATIIHYLGVMPAILLTFAPKDDDNLDGRVKFGFGAGCDPRHQEIFEERFGLPLLEAWSMTETGAGAVTIADREPRHVGQRCMGRPSSDMEYRIVDESGNDVQTGQGGKFLVRARGADPQKGFFSGYYKDEQATRAAWEGGWFHTGDVVREGSDGSLFFVDRHKNIIRRSGENIAAVEVEATLLGHPGVANCAVTAVPDELRGEEVFAFVVPRATGAANDAVGLVEHCLQGLSYFKAPAYIAFVDDLPLTASQKVNRAEVRKQALLCIAEAACADLRDAKKRRRVRPG